MKSFYLIVLLCLIAFTSCQDSNNGVMHSTATIYEAVGQKEALPVLAAIDLQSDPISARQYLAEGNALKENRSDTLSVSVNTYLNGVCKNSLFKLLQPFVDHPYGKGTSEFKQSAILGLSLTTDTEKVNKIIVDSQVNKFGLSFLWVPAGAMELNDSRFEVGKGKAADLFALNSSGKPLMIKNLGVESVNLETNLLKRWANTLNGKSHHKHIITLDEVDRENITSRYADDTSILLKYAVNGRDYYYTGTVAQIKDGLTVLAE